jgi:hypothetical protein
MLVSRQRKLLTALFDEYHSESWTVSLDRAREINPRDPAASCYSQAAGLLGARDFVIESNCSGHLTHKVLSRTDLLVLPHPCDSRWEKTTSSHSPRLTAEEIHQIHGFVQSGGGLIVITEYEHEKYGDNLNDLLAPFGIRIENTTVRSPSDSLHSNATWFLAHHFGKGTWSGTGHLVEKVGFFRAGSCVLDGEEHREKGRRKQKDQAGEHAEASLVWRASKDAEPSGAGLIALARYGQGRVVVVTDSSLFGDRHMSEFDHTQLWLNLAYWASAPAFASIEPDEPESPVKSHKAWKELKEAVNYLRTLQLPDASIEDLHHAEVHRLVYEAIIPRIRTLAPMLPHEEDYLEQVIKDFEEWMEAGFKKPDFGKSLALYTPVENRQNHIENLVIFPMYTPNASREYRFEALLLSTPWPEWLAELEKNHYPNEKFAPGHLVDYTQGYQSECAVLFPETVSVLTRPTNNFSTIFCDREARRLQKYSLEAARIVNLDAHPQLECFLASLDLIQDTMALWDLIHDKSHSLGELPFDPFMIRQKAPFWMYGLEELRVDLRSFCEATRLAGSGFPFAHYVTYAILLDRIFRFPITGPRVRNYDALGGQLLFSYLHQKDVLLWSDNKLKIAWAGLPAAVAALRDEIQVLYKSGSDLSKMSFWLAAHELVAKYVKPNIASKWRRENREITDEADPKKWISLVHDDEFPLGTFHMNLQQKLQKLGM